MGPERADRQIVEEMRATKANVFTKGVQAVATDRGTGTRWRLRLTAARAKHGILHYFNACRTLVDE